MVTVLQPVLVPVNKCSLTTILLHTSVKGKVNYSGKGFGPFGGNTSTCRFKKTGHINIIYATTSQYIFGIFKDIMVQKHTSNVVHSC